MALAAPFTYRPAAERFHSRSSWLDSWHSFSFAGHDHPAWRGFGPLRVINDDRLQGGSGFGLHPHRDMDIITVMVEGQLDHQDTLGSRGRLHPGDVQVMEAGTGLQHSEINASTEPCRLLQIWIEPSAPNRTPRYCQRQIQLDNGWTPLVVPEGQGEALSISRPIRLWRAQPQADQSLPIPLAATSLGWLQVIDGSLHLEGGDGLEPEQLQRGDGLGFAAGTLQAIKAIGAKADLLLFDLGPAAGLNPSSRG